MSQYLCYASRQVLFAVYGFYGNSIACSLETNEGIRGWSNAESHNYTSWNDVNLCRITQLLYITLHIFISLKSQLFFCHFLCWFLDACVHHLRFSPCFLFSLNWSMWIKKYLWGKLYCSGKSSSAAKPTNDFQAENDPIAPSRGIPREDIQV